MMKRSILGVAFAAVLGTSAIAQTTEVAVVEPNTIEDYSLNKFNANWFITAEGGANILFSHHDIKRDLADRFGPAAGLYVGKWFSPIFGARAGFMYEHAKGIADNARGTGALVNDFRPEGKYYKTVYNYAGAQLDAMLNVTNWWCGYNPTRFYNAVVYAGGGVIMPFVKNADGDYKRAHNNLLDLRAGLINKFRLSDKWSLSLDIRYQLAEGLYDGNSEGDNHNNLSAYLGVTYNFGKSTWDAPVIPVPVPVQDCETYENRLQAANARVNDLERELRDCIDRPVQKTAEVKAGPLATIYYPIGVSRLSAVDKKVLGAVAEVMKSNPNVKYNVTGWADNYTGTDEINERLRHARANGVQECLEANGVDAGQLNVGINSGSLFNGGEKYVSLDRAVTIEEAK